MTHGTFWFRMIKEWIQSSLTKADPLFRRLGYVYASVALEARFSRCQTSWKNHLEKCRDVIRINVPVDCQNVLVVGSGPLLEVPVTELLQSCQKLYLLDVVHPRSVQKWARRNSRVQLLTADVTGFSQIHEDEKAIRQLKFQPPALALPHVDYVVSANLLSQLSLEPYEILKKKFRWADNEFFGQLARKMGEDHLNWLRAFAARSTVLISDCERIYFNREREEVDRACSSFQSRDGSRLCQWDWEIAPLGEVSRHYGYKMRVEARLL